MCVGAIAALAFCATPVRVGLFPAVSVFVLVGAWRAVVIGTGGDCQPAGAQTCHEPDIGVSRRREDSRRADSRRDQSCNADKHGPTSSSTVPWWDASVAT